MPLFGIDDVILSLVSGTALLWIKRNDVVASIVYHAVSALTRDNIKAQELAAACVKRLPPAPSLLLKGFDLDEGLTANRKLLCSVPYPSSSLSAANNDDSLFRTSVVTEIAGAVPTPPMVPHRRYNQHKYVAPVFSLAKCTEQEVSDQLKNYSVADMQGLFAKMQNDVMWSSVVHVTRGIDRAGEKLKHLSIKNVEAALRTLFRANKPELAVAYFFSYSSDIMPADDIIISLFDTCRRSEGASMDLYRCLLPFRSRWTPAIYACCLTTTAKHNFDDALTLYDEYKKKTCSAKSFWGASSFFREHVISNDGNEEGKQDRQLEYLYHVIIPLVIQKQPSLSAEYVRDMIRCDGSAAPDVFLRCLDSDCGRTLAEKYIRDKVLLPKAQTEAFSSQDLPLSILAINLYMMKPSAMNLNSLLSIVATDCTLSADSNICTWEAAVIGVGGWIELFRRVPMQSDVDAAVLARTITEHKVPRVIANQFLLAMLRRKHFVVVPILASYMALLGDWQVAARSMSIFLSNQRGVLSADHLRLCVDADVHCGRWTSALFWMERSLEGGTLLLPETCELALSISHHWNWNRTKCLVKKMKETAQDVCSNKPDQELLMASVDDAAAGRETD